MMESIAAAAKDAASAVDDETTVIPECPLCGSTTVSDLLVAPDRFHLRTEMYRLARCSSCRGVWLANPPKPEEMGRHYTAEYHKGISAAGETDALERWSFARKRVASYKQGGAILDIGCSSGAFLSTMKGPAWQLYGIEMEESTAEKARSKTGAEIFVGDALAAPYLPGSFDVITTFDVLEHVYSPKEFLAKVFLWLKPGGIYYATMPNIDSWEARFFGTHWYGLELPRHLFHMSPRALRSLMTSLGFEEVLLKTPPVSYAERSLGYVSSTVVAKFGGDPLPQATPTHRNVIYRTLRKGFRLAALRPAARLASIAGAGPCMEVAFKKPAGNHEL